MSHNNADFLGNYIQNLLYSSLELFASIAYPNIEDPTVKQQKQNLIDKSTPILKKRAKEAIKFLKSKNITTIDSQVTNQDVVAKVMNKIQKDMEKDAETLSKN